MGGNGLLHFLVLTTEFCLPCCICTHDETTGYHFSHDDNRSLVIFVNCMDNSISSHSWDRSSLAAPLVDAKSRKILLFFRTLHTSHLTALAKSTHYRFFLLYERLGAPGPATMNLSLKLRRPTTVFTAVEISRDGVVGTFPYDSERKFSLVCKYRI